MQLFACLVVLPAAYYRSCSNGSCRKNELNLLKLELSGLLSLNTFL